MRPLLLATGGFLPTMQAENQDPSQQEGTKATPSPTDSLPPNDVHSEAQCVLHRVRLALWDRDGRGLSTNLSQCQDNPRPQRAYSGFPQGSEGQPGSSSALPWPT